MKNYRFNFLSYPQLKNFIKVLKNYKSNHIFLRNKKYFNWSFKSGSYYNIAILSFKNKIISFISFYNLFHYDNNLRKDLLFLSLAYTYKNVIPGQFFLLLKYLKKEKKVSCFLTNPNDHAINLNKKIGFRFFKLDHFFFKSKKKISGIGKISKFNLISLKLNNYKKNCKQFFFEDFKLINNYIFNFQFPKKSKKYLINKYVKHPIFEYIFLGYFKNKKIQSIIILRVQIYKNKKIGRIVEFIGEQKNIIRFNFILHQILKKFNLEYIDFYCFGFSKKSLKNAGFFNKSDIKSIILPNYFYPYINKNIDLNVGIMSKKNFNIKKFVYFKGDGDLDTPV